MQRSQYGVQPEVNKLIDPLEALWELLVWEEVDINPDPKPEVEADADDDVEVLDSVDGWEEGTEEGGADVVLEIVDAVEVVEGVRFEGILLVEVVDDKEFEFEFVEEEGIDDWEVAEEEVDDPVLIELDELDCLAVHDLVPLRRTNPSLQTHPRWSEVTREFYGHLRQFPWY